MRPRLGIVGAGKVGSSLGRLLYAQGYTISAVYSRTESTAISLATDTNAVVVTSAQEAALQADLVFLTVPDDAIASIARELAIRSWDGKAFVHTSGAKDAAELEPLAARCARTGSLHPAYPFADTHTALAELRGTVFAVEAMDIGLNNWLVEIVAALTGTVIHIPPGKKSAYHLALVMASNFTVILYAAAQRLLAEIGTERTTADHALYALLSATIDNLKKHGPPDALTGPLTRADLGTIEAHLSLLENDAILKQSYQGLTRLAYPLLAEMGIPTKFMEDVERLFIRDTPERMEE
jgi:predicted short-subunit dehydrogenase-like oxidoreductase (DUF2520 family)